MRDSRRQYEDEMGRCLEACAEGIDKIKAKAQRADVREKLGLYDQLEDLVIMERRAKVELAGLKEAGPEAWEKRKAALDASIKSLQEAL